MHVVPRICRSTDSGAMYRRSLLTQTTPDLACIANLVRRPRPARRAPRDAETRTPTEAGAPTRRALQLHPVGAAAAGSRRPRVPPLDTSDDFDGPEGALGAGKHAMTLSSSSDASADSAPDASEREDSDWEDDCCVCGQPGELLMCEGCPRAAHVACAGLPAVPEEDWYCPECIARRHEG